MGETIACGHYGTTLVQYGYNKRIVTTKVQPGNYPDNRGFPWHAKNGENRKTSEDIV